MTSNGRFSGDEQVGVQRRAARRRVMLAESVAEQTIRLGGIGVIAAVLGMMVFLFLQVVPLFQAGRLSAPKHGRVLQFTGDARPSSATIALVIDEFVGLATTVTREGEAVTFSLADGAVVERRRLVPDDASVTAWTFTPADGVIALGLADGSTVTGTISFASEFPLPEQRPAAAVGMAVGERRVLADLRGPGTGGLIERVNADIFRLVRPAADLKPPQPPMDGAAGAVVAIDHRVSATNASLLVIRADGTAELSTGRLIKPLGGGASRIRWSRRLVDVPMARDEAARSAGVFITSDAADVFLLSSAGELRRYALISEGERGGRALEADAIQTLDEGERVTAVGMMLGGRTLAIGTDRGRVLGAFVARDDSAFTPDRRRLVLAHRHPAPRETPAAVVALASGSRDRTYAAVDSAGVMHLRNMTSGKLIGTIPIKGQTGGSPGGGAAVAIAPKGDGAVCLDDSGSYSVVGLDLGSPEATFASLFGKVWYEGELRPGYVYQAGGGLEAGEPKFSLMPLIFGTLKATVYAMLFALPIAVLAAMYSSEMLHPGVRNAVKPVVEVMASLPSVVLGFLAALVLAPWAREWLPSILLAFLIVPLAVVTAAHLWQMLPVRITSRLRTGQHLLLTGAMALAGLGLAVPAGLVVEQALFRPTPAQTLMLAGSFEPADDSARPAWLGNRSAVDGAKARRLEREGLYLREGRAVRPVGSPNDPSVREIITRNGLDRADIRLWLDGRIGGGFGGWLLLLAAPGLALAMVLKPRLVDPVLAEYERGLGTLRAGAVELVKFVGVCGAGLGLAALAGWLLDGAGMDPRDSVFGPFSQRNSLIVGIMMGFAVIPIIYTISEDALSSVSVSLRSASLGAGATRWQTAVRVVLPVALPGIFSAAMIGLGRAVGETMIVLMATGNTSSMDWNIFSGFRTLAANIAVELPEAARGGTHYRVLFLCGLVLFVMTLLVNTLAELVRQRFRRRAAGL